VLLWLADENFNNDILPVLFRAKRDLDIVRAQDVGLTGAGDQSVLSWAADHSRVLLTHDVSTITAHAYRRVMKGDTMPGVFESKPPRHRAVCGRRYNPALGMQQSRRMGRPGPVSATAVALPKE